ncbi:MAG: exodeoxyribonuclease VII large subunit [Bacteroidales bacterium]|nr:exodeoxyribonuclease VII large subunit [Candidatus Latescibacterota bacterium]
MNQYDSGNQSRTGLDDVYTVSEITDALRQNLESEFPSIRVAGEIANFKAHISGHYYLTLRDEKNLLRGVMFKRNTYGLAFLPDNGMFVIASGRMSHYGGSGQTQLIMDSMVVAGRGGAEIEFERLLGKLVNEGLTDISRKQAIPLYPGKIAVITSKTGAVIRDIRKTVERRWPVADLVHIHSEVQGPKAIDSLVRAFSRIEAMKDVDLVILARGGGSSEDLWVFNLEPVARAVSGCRYPVITGIGHETDTTICDHVADLRAPTPTAAAELATPSRMDILDRLDRFAESIRKNWLQSSERRLNLVEYIMRGSVFELFEHKKDDALLRVEDLTARLDELWSGISNSHLSHIDDAANSMNVSLGNKCRVSERRLADSTKRLVGNTPDGNIKAGKESLRRLQGLIRSEILGSIRMKKSRSDGIIRTMEGLYPLGILKRGYTFCMTGDGNEVVGSVDGVSTGQRIKVMFHDGNASCLVEKKGKEKGWR